MLDEPGIPLEILILILIVIPCFIGLFFGLFAFKGMTPHVFHCGRCDRDFLRKAWRGFPRECPRCRARDWNG